MWAAKCCECTRYVYRPLSGGGRHADLSLLAANTQNKQSKNTVYFVEHGWG